MAAERAKLGPAGPYSPEEARLGLEREPCCGERVILCFNF